MVVGAGRGPLVRASLQVQMVPFFYVLCSVLFVYFFIMFTHHFAPIQAAEETGRKLKVYAVEKNPNAVITLHVSPC